MNKWAIYTCYKISWGWEEIDQWEFEIIQLTEKTCKLKHIKKWFFNFCGRFYWRDKDKKVIETITIKSVWNMKDFIWEEFTYWDRWSWTPFIFTIKLWK